MSNGKHKHVPWQAHAYALCMDDCHQAGEQMNLWHLIVNVLRLVLSQQFNDMHILYNKSHNSCTHNN